MDTYLVPYMFIHHVVLEGHQVTIFSAAGSLSKRSISARVSVSRFWPSAARVRAAAGRHDRRSGAGGYGPLRRDSEPSGHAGTGSTARHAQLAGREIWFSPWPGSALRERTP